MKWGMKNRAALAGPTSVVKAMEACCGCPYYRRLRRLISVLHIVIYRYRHFVCVHISVVFDSTLHIK